MVNNVLIFGMTGSGKSTLLGYIITHSMDDEEFLKCDQINRRHIEDMGKEYYDANSLAYFSDKGKEEIWRPDSAPGSTKFLHYEPIAEYNFLALDSPGIDQSWRDKFEGLFLGNIGVFTVELIDILKLARKIPGSNKYEQDFHRIFDSVKLWCKLNGAENLIIVLTKIDIYDYSESVINRAIKFIRDIHPLESVPIVPISIDVINRKGTNIFDTNNNLVWDNDKTLMSYINRRLIDLQKDTNKAYVAIDRFYRRAGANNRPAFRVKVMEGSLSKGDTVFVGPLVTNKRSFIVKGQIHSLKCEKQEEPCEKLYKNQIGGVMLKNTRTGGSWRTPVDIKKINANITRTAVMVHDLPQQQMGNILKFDIKRTDVDAAFVEKMEKLNVWNRVSIIWFGKIVPMFILNIQKDKLTFSLDLISASMKDILFILPNSVEGEYVFQDFIMQLNMKGNVFYIQTKLRGAESLPDSDMIDITFSVPQNINSLTIKEKNKKKPVISRTMNNTYIVWKGISIDMINDFISYTNRLLKAIQINDYTISLQ